MLQNEKAIKEYVESRLCEWGEWAKKTGLPRLGYPSSSSDASILGVNVQKGREQHYEDSSAEEMEVFILELGAHFPKERTAIVLYYSSREEDTAKIARNEKISIRVLQNRLKSGRTFLAGLLAHKL